MCVCSAPEQCAYTDGAKSYVVCSGGFTVTVSHGPRGGTRGEGEDGTACVGGGVEAGQAEEQQIG